MDDWGCNGNDEYDTKGGVLRDMTRSTGLLRRRYWHDDDDDDDDNDDDDDDVDDHDDDG